MFRGSGASLSVLANTLHICFSFAMCRVDISNFSQSQSAKIATSLDERWWNTSFFQSLNKGPCRYFSKQDSNNHSITNHDCLLSRWRLFLSLFDQWVFFCFWRSVQPLYCSLSPPPNLSSLPFCSGIKFSGDFYSTHSTIKWKYKKTEGSEQQKK